MIFGVQQDSESTCAHDDPFSHNSAATGGVEVAEDGGVQIVNEQQNPSQVSCGHLFRRACCFSVFSPQNALTLTVVYPVFSASGGVEAAGDAGLWVGKRQGAHPAAVVLRAAQAPQGVRE